MATIGWPSQPIVAIALPQSLDFAERFGVGGATPHKSLDGIESHESRMPLKVHRDEPTTNDAKHKNSRGFTQAGVDEPVEPRTLSIQPFSFILWRRARIVSSVKCGLISRTRLVSV